jgi:hypothetical protein
MREISTRRFYHRQRTLSWVIKRDLRPSMSGRVLNLMRYMFSKVWLHCVYYDVLWDEHLHLYCPGSPASWRAMAAI